MYGQFRIRKDYSYTTTRFWRPGIVLVGDAACFIDPVLSTGVHLATYSGLLTARSVNTCLRGGVDEATCFDETERRYRADYNNFYDFLIAFYDMHQDQESYFWRARKVLNTEEQSNEAFVRLVAGGANAPDFFGARCDLGAILTKHTENEEATLAIADLARDIKSKTGSVEGEAMRELAFERMPDKPRPGSALVATDDGAHWQLVTP
jgi:halogenation protein CepH